jgi:hypothetical protein
MMNILKSRTVWAVVLIFVTAGVNAITDFLSPGTLEIVQGVLGILAIYFRVNAVQKF